MHKILLAGQDLRLLSTRAEVLKKTGAGVICCRGAEALRRVELETPDLVVLCHSLEHADAEAIASAAHEHSGKTKVLRVVSDFSQDEALWDGGFDATVPAEPKGLIRRATELLQTTLCISS